MEAFGNVLIVGAHYDDTDLGAGATAAKLIEQGHKVYKITLTDTVVKSVDMNLNIENERVVANSAAACKALGGVEELEFKPEPYGKLAFTKEIMQRLEHIIFEYKIDTAFMHYADDYNSDHMAAHKICKTAARHVKNIFMFQSNPYITFEQFCPNVFVDVTSTIDKKRAALDCYDSEHDRWGHLFDTNIQRNATWGYGNHCEYAEGFASIKMLL